MFRAGCKFKTDEGTLNGGAVVSQKELDCLFSDEEQQRFKDEGLLVSVIPDDAPSFDDDIVSIEDLVNTPNKEALKVPELDQVLTHYGLDTTGNKPDKVSRIVSFEEDLESDFEDLDEASLAAIAKYCDVDATLERDDLIAAIELKLEDQ